MKKFRVKRGEIFYADLSGSIGSEQKGIRLVLIIQNDIGNNFSPTTIVAALTSQVKKYIKTHVSLSNDLFDINKDSTVLCEQIRTIDKCRLREKVCTLDKKTMKEVDISLKRSLGLV